MRGIRLPQSLPLRLRTSIFLAAFLPGLVAGTQVAGLIFFLNPDLPFEPLPVTRGVLFYGMLLGSLGCLITLPFTWQRVQRAKQALPWSLTAVLAASGIGAWIHASFFTFFLPPGINRQLLKAAIWLSLAALICFYTILLHRLRNRPYGRRSWFLFSALALAATYVVMERRETFEDRHEPVPRATTIEAQQRPQLYVVGLDSATLDALLPLAEQERLPFFAKVLKEGFYTRLQPLHPSWALPLWATLATGKFPYRHGIVGKRVSGAPFLGCDTWFRLLPLGMGFKEWGVCREGRAVGSLDKRALDLWEILSRLGVPSGVIGWPLTTPAQPDVELQLSDGFFLGDGQAQMANPGELGGRAKLFRTRVQELDPRLVSRFGSAPPQEDLEALAQDLWREELSFFLLDQEPMLEALFVALPGLAELSSRYFGAYAAVQFEGDQSTASILASQRLSAYYMHLDSYLARLWEKQPVGPRMMVIVSVSGAGAPSGIRRIWHDLTRQSVLGGSLEQGSDGVLMFLGTGFQAGTRVQPANLVDMTPTLLYAMGAPLARDLDGAVLTSAFTTTFLARQPLTFVPSYETLSPTP